MHINFLHITDTFFTRYPRSNVSSNLTKTNKLIYSANQLTCLYMNETLALKEVTGNWGRTRKV